MSASELQRLQRWYQRHCDGDWEHTEQVKIYTLDNPGWRLKIDIARTDVAGIELDWVKSERSENDWVFYRSTGELFEAACGPLNLAEAIERFMEFVAGAGA